MEARSIIYIVLLTIFHPSYGAEWDYRDFISVDKLEFQTALSV